MPMNRPSTSSRIFLLADRRPQPGAAYGPLQRYRLARVALGSRPALAERPGGEAKRP
jgi:hypothetical protein